MLVGIQADACMYHILCTLHHLRNFDVTLDYEPLLWADETAVYTVMEDKQSGKHAYFLI